jgi:hypothetical protein
VGAGPVNGHNVGAGPSRVNVGAGPSDGLNVGAGLPNVLAPPVGLQMLVPSRPLAAPRPTPGAGLASAAAPSLPSFANFLGLSPARAETQTGGPYRADQTVLPFDLPYGAPRESNLEARASPAVVASPLVPVSFGMRGPTALSQSAGAELVKLTVQTPKLVIDDKTDPKTIPVQTKAFVRDVLKVFALAQWGVCDDARCLFLSQALVGIAKSWFDTWSLATKTYTTNDILVHLQRRFAPQIQSLEEDARLKLQKLSFRMREVETVIAYQSRFEAVITDIPTITEGERLFAFRSGLNEVLAAACAVDRANLPFVSYDDLVLHALGEERRLLATRQTRSAIRSNAALLQSADADLTDSEPEPTAVGRRPPRSALALVRPPTKHTAGRAASQPNVGRAKKPTKYRAPDGTVIPFAALEMRRRSDPPRCFCCGELGHSSNACPRGGTVDPPQ